MTIYMSRLEFGSKSYSYFKLLGGRATLQYACYSNPTLPLANPKAVTPPCAATLFCRGNKGEDEKRKRGELGHVFIDPRRSSPKIGWGSFPLSVFPHLHGFPRCSWWCHFVWSSTARLDARKKGKQSGIVVVVVITAVAFVVCKGKP
jgi:hypothetical protein